ncbi:crosslink repair DNA glycosylase YcaQ family protein [Micromonospora sp. KC213]|uniref:DNA glycosylase AlkZ-like family protein n=1 Tax=Micromonospora sp. KC213 TaxID=2530378 RepID=UPI00326179A8
MGDGSLVKTFGPRGTVHLLPNRELPLWTGALGAVPPATNGVGADARLTPEQTDEVVAAIAAALADAELTVEDLNTAVAARTGGWATDPVVPAFGGMWPRWRQAIHLAAHRGVLCFGRNRGRNVTDTNPQRWLPGFRPAPAADARRPGPALPVRIRSSHAAAVRAMAVRTTPMGDRAVRVPRR